MTIPVGTPVVHKGETNIAAIPTPAGASDGDIQLIWVAVGVDSIPVPTGGIQVFSHNVGDDGDPSACLSTWFRPVTTDTLNGVVQLSLHSDQSKQVPWVAVTVAVSNLRENYWWTGTRQSFGSSSGDTELWAWSGNQHRVDGIYFAAKMISGFATSDTITWSPGKGTHLGHDSHGSSSLDFASVGLCVSHINSTAQTEADLKVFVNGATTTTQRSWASLALPDASAPISDVETWYAMRNGIKSSVVWGKWNGSALVNPFDGTPL